MRWSELELSEAVGQPSALLASLPAGVYGDGLLTLPTAEDAALLRESLEWDLGREFVVVAHNAFGDLFLRPPDAPGVWYLWLQYGKGRQVAADVTALEQLLASSPEDRSKFLETEAFTHVKGRLGVLPYGKVYTHLPIPALGGSGDPDRCGSGRLDVYLSIVSQSFSAS